MLSIGTPAPELRSARYDGGVVLGLVLALGTSVAWAFGNVFIQRSSRVVGEARSLFWSLVLGALVAAAAIPLLDHPTRAVDAAAVAWLITAGLASLVAYGGMFYAFSRSELTLTVPVVSCWSLVAGLVSFVGFGERPGAAKLAGAAVVFAGVMAVSVGATRADQRRQRSAGESSPVGSGGPAVRRRAVAAALVAGCCFGLMFPALGQAARSFGTFGAAALVYLVALAAGLPLARAARLDLSWPPRRTWPVLLGTGFFETAGFVLLTTAALLAPLSVVAPVASLASTFTVIYALLFLGERPGGLALAGALLASVGVVMLAL
jgi:drug/metabolite transporter (DMT)-like permease